MPVSYRFIVHSGFKKQHEDFIKRNPRLERSLWTQYEKAVTNPVTAGKSMAQIPVEELRGKLYRLYVGGRRGYRFVYFFSERHGIVLPAWISPVRRSQLDYDKADWLDYALDYSSDLAQGNIDKFEDWTNRLLK